MFIRRTIKTACICFDDMELKDLENRHSVRSFEPREIDGKTANTLRAEITMTNTHEAGMHFSLVFNDGRPMKGYSQSYGIFRNVENYLVATVDTSFPDVREKAGYYAQRFVMKAQSLGLGSCYVGATYNPKEIDVPLRAGWQILFIVVFGYPLGKERMLANAMMRLIHRHHKDGRDMFIGDDAAYEHAVSVWPWLPEALQAAACAPSSYNKQPVRFSIVDDGATSTITASVDKSNPKNLTDLGIAKFNFGAVAPGEWEWGNGAPFLT